MPMRISTMPAAQRAVAPPCEPAEAAARLLVLTTLVYGCLVFLVAWGWYAAGWIGETGFHRFWRQVPYLAVPFLFIYWFTAWALLRVATFTGLAVAGIYLVRKVLLPLVGVGRLPDPSFPSQILDPPVQCLVAFAGALLVCWLARLCRADLKRA